MEKTFVLDKTETIQLTRELAEEMRSMMPSPTERALDQKRVEYLRNRAESGLLVPFQWAKARVNGTWMRMNGQHSSEMLCALPDDLFPKSLSVHLDHYMVESMDGLSLLFQQFDARRSSRSRTDVAGAYKGLHDELSALPLEVGRLGIEGIGYFNKMVLGAPVPPGDELYRYFAREDFWPFLLWLPEIFNIKTPELRRKEIVAAMFASYDKNKIAAKSFWKDVQAGGNVSEDNHPTRTLDIFYQSVKEETDRKKRAKPHELYQAGILAWNAFREGKKLSTIKKVKSDPDVAD